jgi:hypothetical protein
MMSTHLDQLDRVRNQVELMAARCNNLEDENALLKISTATPIVPPPLIPVVTSEVGPPPQTGDERDQIMEGAFL